MKYVKHLSLVAIVVSAVAGFVVFDLDQYLALDNLQHWVASEPVAAGFGFAVIYLGVTALSIPGAGPLSLIAGAVFGLWYGVLIVSFASSFGATIAMMISRTLLQEWVQIRFEQALQKVNTGVLRDGALYLFALRLIPPIPFFIINLVFGLTKMRARTFYLTSQIGMLPATFLYVNAGASLGSIENLTFFEIFKPEVILSFMALIAFPFIAKAVLNRTRFAPSTDG